MYDTFAFISSRLTVATVLVGCLFFFSSFCGLSRRCSRCLITWFHRDHSSKEGLRAEMGEGDKRCRSEKRSSHIMCELHSSLLIWLYLYMFGSLQTAGCTAQRGYRWSRGLFHDQLSQHVMSTDLSGPAWESVTTSHMHSKLQNLHSQPRSLIFTLFCEGKTWRYINMISGNIKKKKINFV